MSLVQKIVSTIRGDIEKGIYHKNQKLLSINRYSKRHRVSRDTIEKAYIRLKEEGYIFGVKGRGYFVSGKPDARIKVLLLFNNLGAYKTVVYDAIVDSLGSRAKVDIQVHHYNPVLLEEIIDHSLGNYHYYVVMPHFFYESGDHDYLRVLKKIPAGQLILLDKDLPGLPQHSAVFQDFRKDIYDAFKSVTRIFEKYTQVIAVIPPESQRPEDIVQGVRDFCRETGKSMSVTHSREVKQLEKHTAYVVLKESDLVELLKILPDSGYQLGHDTGIISYNDTIFKELLHITVVTTDFEQMGRTTAGLILNNELLLVKNPFRILLRKSL